MSVSLRLAERGDASALATLRARAVVECDDHPECVDPQAEHDRMLLRIHGYIEGTYRPSCALGAGRVWVAEVDGERAGFVALHPSDRMGCDAELQWLFVAPAQQRRGVATHLLTPSLGWAVAQEWCSVVIDCPPEMQRARAFYFARGAEKLDGYWLLWPDAAVGLRQLP